MDNVDVLEFPPLYDVSDYTEFTSDEGRISNLMGKEEFRANRSIWLQTGNGPVQCRICASKCYGAKQVSVTVRWKKQEEDGVLNYRRTREANLDKTDYWPGKKTDAEKEKELDGYWFRLEEIAELIAGQVLRKGEPGERHGVIAIAGATNCGKSQLARALVAKSIQLDLRERKGGRRPHLVTIEDPIEEYYVKPPEGTEPAPDDSTKIGVDYTPRELRMDTRTLSDGLQDALRQTPTVVYVGEVREREDWQEVFKFAGSGHLIVTTTHAGTLVEAMDSMLKAHDAKTPAQRKYVASRILAVVQLRPYDTEVLKKTALLPEMWRRTTKGINDLVADGLASVLPNCPTGEPDPTISSLGRAWFARRLNIGLQEHKLSNEQRKNVESDIEDQAVAWDLLQE